MNLALSAKDYVSEEMVMPGFGSELLNSFLEFKEQGLFSDFNLKVEYEVFYVSLLLKIFNSIAILSLQSPLMPIIVQSPILFFNSSYLNTDFMSENGMVIY